MYKDASLGSSKLLLLQQITGIGSDRRMTLLELQAYNRGECARVAVRESALVRQWRRCHAERWISSADHDRDIGNQ